MLNALRLLGQELREKSRLAGRGDGPGSVVRTLVGDGSLSMVLYRLMQGARESHLGPLEMVFNKLNSMYGNCVIGRGTDFGPGFVLFHSDGVVINGKVKGGSRIRLQHQVTIGANEQDECPTLGSDIIIGAGAKIIGPVKIGDGARIGANAVVVHDVLPNTTVVGIPAKPVKRRDRG
ncbi:MAG: serine acetyltransferase [Byssovorax sp.]